MAGLPFPFQMPGGTQEVKPEVVKRFEAIESEVKDARGSQRALADRFTADEKNVLNVEATVRTQKNNIDTLTNRVKSAEDTVKKAQSDITTINTASWFNNKFISQFDSVFPTKLQQQFPSQLNKVLSPDPTSWFNTKFSSAWNSNFSNDFTSAFNGKFGNKTPDEWFKNQFGGKYPVDWFNGSFDARFIAAMPSWVQKTINDALPNLYLGKAGYDAFKLGFTDLSKITKDPAAWAISQFNSTPFAKNNIPDLMNFQKQFNGLSKPLADVKSKLDALSKPLNDIVGVLNARATKVYKYPGYDVNFLGLVNAYDRSPITATGMFDYLRLSGDRLNSSVTSFAGGRKESLIDVVLKAGLTLGPVMRDIGEVTAEIKLIADNLIKVVDDLKTTVDSLSKALPKPPLEVPGIWKP